MLNLNFFIHAFLIPRAVILYPLLMSSNLFQHSSNNHKALVQYVLFPIWILRLCTLDGRPLRGPSELENNQHYVAVGADKFKALPYNLCVPRRGVITEKDLIQGYETGQFCLLNNTVICIHRRLDLNILVCKGKWRHASHSGMGFYFLQHQSRQPALA